MKIHYTLTVLIALLCSTISYGQTEKGSIFVGGDSFLGMGFSSDYSSFSISPGAHYFIIDNLSLGLSIPYSFSHTETETSEFTSNSIGLAPSIRYYFGETALKPYIGVEYGFYSYSNKVKTDLVNDKYSENQSNLTPGAGLAYFFNDKFAVNFELGYHLYKPFDGNSDNNALRGRGGFIIKLK